MTSLPGLRSIAASIGSVLVCTMLAACPGNDSTADSTGGSSSTTAADSTTAIGTGSSTTASASDSTTGTPGCDPSACESLDLEACAACDPDDCAVLSGYPWQQDEPEQWCLEGAVPIACQEGSLCFDYFLTLCDAEGQAYYVDMGCVSFDFEAAGFTECEPPAPMETFCQTGGSSGTG